MLIKVQRRFSENGGRRGTVRPMGANRPCDGPDSIFNNNKYIIINKNYFFSSILNEGKSVVTVSRCGVSLWNLQMASNGCPPSLSWSVQTGEMEGLWICRCFCVDKYKAFFVGRSRNETKVIIVTLTR